MLIKVKAGVDVVTEELALRGLILGWQQVETEVGRLNVVAFLEHQFAMRVVAGHRPGKGEGQQQPK